VRRRELPITYFISFRRRARELQHAGLQPLISIKASMSMSGFRSRMALSALARCHRTSLSTMQTIPKSTSPAARQVQQISSRDEGRHETPHLQKPFSTRYLRHAWLSLCGRSPLYQCLNIPNTYPVNPFHRDYPRGRRFPENRRHVNCLVVLKKPGKYSALWLPEYNPFLS